jgi:hypothetical protein
MNRAYFYKSSNSVEQNPTMQPENYSVIKFVSAIGPYPEPGPHILFL